jgi:hypothetical protein
MAPDKTQLEARLATLLPEMYRDTYEDIQPVAMGSAGLEYNPDGSVAWDRIWGSFCDLAMAGGPPHKGRLLEPGSPADIDARPAVYQDAMREVCRGIGLVTDLLAEPSADPGWVVMSCPSEAMAGWLVRAISMENVAVRQQGVDLELPVGPAYRLDKEIKNVVTVIAKTCHYWSEHMDVVQRREIAALLASMNAEAPLLQPGRAPAPTGADREARAGFTDALEAAGLVCSARRYDGWQGVEVAAVDAAVTAMRLLVGCNVLGRREERTLFVPVNVDDDPSGRRAAAAILAVTARA